MKPRAIRIGDVEYHILFADLLRPLTDRERTDLRKDIRKNGVVVPVVVDEDHGVIDGINRLEIAAELGLKRIPTDVRRHMGDLDKKRELALALNVGRRQLTADEQAALKAERAKQTAEKRAEGKSTRQIAEETGVSQTQVLRDLKGAAIPGGTPEPGGSPGPPGGKVAGRDGKKYPATQGKGLAAGRVRPPVTTAEPKQAAQPQDPELAEQPASLTVALSMLAPAIAYARRLSADNQAALVAEFQRQLERH